MAEYTYSVTWLHAAYHLRQAQAQHSQVDFATFLRMHPKTKRKWIMRAKREYLAHQHEAESRAQYV